MNNNTARTAAAARRETIRARRWYHPGTISRRQRRQGRKEGRA